MPEIKELGKVLNMEELGKKDDGNLTEEELGKIRDSVYDDDKEKEVIEIEVDAEEKKDEKKDDEIVIEEGKETEEEKLARETKEKEDLENETEEEKVARETKEKKDKEDNLTDDQKAEAKVTADKVISDFAEANKMSVEDATKELKSIDAISQKYESDPQKLSKTILHLQRSNSKSEQLVKDLETEKDAPQKVNTDYMKKVIEGNQFIIGGKAYLKADIITQYRTDEAKISERLDDEAVFELAVKAVTDQYNSKLDNQSVNIKTDAAKKRVDSLKSIENIDKVFYDGVKKYVEGLSDSVIASKAFNVNNLVNMVKGESYDVDIKKAKADSFKQGQEDAKIIATKKKTPSSSTDKKVGKVSVSLTEDQKTRARDMYDIPGMSDNEKFKAFVGSYPQEFNLDKKDKKEEK